MSIHEMKLRRPALYVATLAMFALALGCLNPKLSLTQSTTPAPSDTTDDAEQDSTSAPTIDLRNVSLDYDFFSLPDSVKLDEAANLLETARGYQVNDQFMAAGYSFALARMMLATVKADSLTGESLEFYQDLAKEVEGFYDDYVSRTTELPAEAPAEAIIAGVEEAEGDTIAGPEDIIRIEKGEIDTTSLAEVLAYRPNLPNVPLERNRQVDNAIKFFQGKGRKVFTRWLQRAETIVPQMQAIIREEGMPEELVYVAMIESGLNNTAYSYAHASGPWQFIRSTGVIFGLEASYWHDERRDPAKATRAACRYLRKLYRQFGDWNLAIASYNCGEGNVERQIRRTGTKDFWKMTRLPRQTRNYVPTYIACAIMAQNPEEFGFQKVNYRSPDPLDTVLVTEMVDLNLAASLIGSDFQTLKALNPSLIRWATPPNDTTWLILPDSTAEKFVTGWANTPDDQKKRQTVHIVKKGETLTAIAKKYGTTSADIKSLAENKGVKFKKLAVGTGLTIPVAPSNYPKVASDFHVTQELPKQEKIVYKVRKGDTISSIAQKFGTTISAIKKKNNLYKSNKIFPGQKLLIRSSRGGVSEASDEDDAPAVDNATAKAEDTPSRSDTHKVKKGETLGKIAAKYGVSVAALQKENRISNPRSLKVGATLRVPNGQPRDNESTQIERYTVRKGDTIAKIAREQGVSIANLLDANSLGKQSVIHPGDKLKIPPK